MTTAPSIHYIPAPQAQASIESLLPSLRHAPTGFTSHWQCGPGAEIRIRNLIATRLNTSTHDCWTLEPAPDSVEETEWATLTIGPNPEGGAVFYRGDIIDRFTPNPDPDLRRLHCMERVKPADYEGMETDLHPARFENGWMIRYLSDGSTTLIDHPE